ncbi:MAG: Gfo/Idh/MocA family oxidoreductase [Lentisphaerae bacterium]|nr:Gfo/Idh/MocA family oxidoreductase [Lentisphaerota bacterium]
MTNNVKPVTVLVVGAGGRGAGYSKFALEYPDRMRVVGVAEPNDVRRERFVAEHGIPAENIATDWRHMVDRPRFADAVIIATQDIHHADPAVTFAELGYHMLLEKPMAPTEEDCRRIIDAVVRAGNLFAVCHVLRYTSYTRKVKELISGGAIGDVVSMQRLEPVGYWHQAHSFVRGNWRNEKESSFMLLAKSCHDIDWIRHVMGVPCEAVSSFGSLKHFRKEEQPEGAADRCLDCGVEADCPYSAIKIYLDRARGGILGWPVDVLVEDVNEANIREALRTDAYGRCVYACDNDVVDNQVVNMRFQGGRTAAFTMTAFTRAEARRTTIFGTRGEMIGDGQTIRVFDFLTDQTEVHDTGHNDGTLLGGHGGGDFGLMDAFTAAVAKEDPDLILSGPAETLESHLMVFAAENARHQNSVVTL